MKKALSIALLSALITACGDDDNDNSASTAPIVDAGDDQTLDERSSVSLAGSVTDHGRNLTFSWSQVSGPMVDLEDATSLTPKFRAPSTGEDETIVLRLSATNDVGTVTDDVTIKISDRSSSPQGIDENSSDRRDDARSNRNENRPVVDSREVRTFNGSNNNISNPLWGAAFTQLARWGDVAYSDGIFSLAGQTRPSARVVSNNIAAQAAGASIPNTFGTTDFLWQWGQFIDHDIGITDGTEETADILVPAGDTFFDPNNTGQQIILFSRALFDPDTGTGTANPRQQENEISAWIDGSMVYGSDDTRATALRVNEDSPYLATSKGDLLPYNTTNQTNANAFGIPAETLFLAGDVRANEQVGLTAMHTLWVREHNRIAANLKKDSPNATGEEIFQATRRLVIAKIQYITYNEYLPALLGADAISQYDGYDDNVNPGLFNEFSVAAYRYGHSLVNETLLRLDAEGNTITDGNLALRDAFFTAPNLLTSETDIDPIFRGMANQLSQKLDTKANNDLRNFLFGQPGQGGLDLVSLNIQRGRDHGVPSYNAMREVFNLTKKNSFAEVTSDPSLQAALAATYTSVDDIDLWVGGLAEDPLNEQGSQLGELFRQMHIVQFEALRDGDRFWYQNDLTEDEISQVERTSLAKVIRDNTSIDDELQDNVFIIAESKPKRGKQIVIPINN